MLYKSEEKCKKKRIRVKFHLALKQSRPLTAAILWKQNCQKALQEYILHRISLKSVSKYGNHGCTFIYDLECYYLRADFHQTHFLHIFFLRSFASNFTKLRKTVQWLIMSTSRTDRRGPYRGRSYFTSQRTAQCVQLSE